MTQANHNDDHKYVFVCGLHRSGTSVLGRNIARFEDCTGFKNTGTPEDEGQFLQNVYPADFNYGGFGRFGFDPRSHRTESSSLLTPENVAKLRASWHAYWDQSKTIRVEKTPGHLLMTRFLQAVFPNSYFIVVRRHPIAVSLATQNLWKLYRTSLHRLLEHWLHCHEILESDKPFLKHVYELNYEKYIQNPVKHHEEIANFIGARVPSMAKNDGYRYVVQVRQQVSRIPDTALEQVNIDHNEKYFMRWSELLNHSPFRAYYQHIARKYESSFNKYDYTLFCDLKNGPGAYLPHETTTVLGILCCAAADLGSLLWRIGARAKWLVLTSTQKIVNKINVVKSMRPESRQS
jgi:hypothetical protein